MSWSSAALITGFVQHRVDALIVQDMGILELISPADWSFTPVHSVIFVVCGKSEISALRRFSQIVLARELNLSQIAAIHQATDATIEFFIHGAARCRLILAVSYISHAHRAQRQRATVPQACRLPYTLLKRRSGAGGSLRKHFCYR